MQKKMAILLGVFLFLIPLTVQAAQPSEKYTKTYLNPFYRDSMTQNIDYNYTVIISPPDGLSSVKSAIIAFDMWINPSRNFTIRVNGQLCNTQFYYVSTTYAGAGRAVATFDCSNIITKSGTYNITYRVLGGNIGSSTAWLELTYMNNPKQDIVLVSGTEYNVGDYATIFLQLKDSQGSPINNGNCYLDVYYPTYDNLSHPVLYTDVGMLYKNESNGLYFFDMIAPNITGIYMLGASCAYAFQINWIYPPEETMKSPNRTQVQGTCLGDTLSLNSYSDGLYQKCTSTSGGGTKYIESYYDFNTTGIDNITTLDAYYAGESTASPTMTMYWWNWTSSAWVLLPNTLTFSGTASASAGTTSGIDEFLSNTIPISNDSINYTTKTVRIRLYSTSGSSFIKYDNWLSLKFLTQEGQIQELKGSGELHVSNALTNLTVNINQTQLDNIYGNLTEIKNYLITINGTTFQINQSLYNDYLSLLAAINSVNATANLSNSLLAELNLSLFNLSQSQNSYFQQILALLHDINYTLNTTLEYKLDLINGTVMQINQTTFDTLQYLVGMNNSLTQYLVVINGTVQQINQSEYQHYLSLLNAINSVNFTANTTLENKIDYLNNTVIPLLYEINATGNTTLELVASINQTLWDDIFVILKDINFTTNTTLEYKLDLINYTTWQSWVMLQNLTVGNVSVTANVNWTEGVPYIWNASNPSKIQHDLVSLANQGIQLVGESYLCLDNSTLQITMNVTNCIQGVCNTYNKTTTTLCAWGCANNQCLPQPTIQFGIAIGIVLMLAGFIYLAWRATKG